MCEWVGLRETSFCCIDTWYHASWSVFYSCVARQIAISVFILGEQVSLCPGFVCVCVRVYVVHLHNAYLCSPQVTVTNMIGTGVTACALLAYSYFRYKSVVTRLWCIKGLGCMQVGSQGGSSIELDASLHRQRTIPGPPLHLTLIHPLQEQGKGRGRDTRSRDPNTHPCRRWHHRGDSQRVTNIPTTR